MRSEPADRGDVPVPQDPDDGGDQDAWGLLRADAEANGYTCKKHACRCGKGWEDYCRSIGILTRHSIDRIKRHESQWDMERE